MFMMCYEVFLFDKGFYSQLKHFFFTLILIIDPFGLKRNSVSPAVILHYPRIYLFLLLSKASLNVKT